MCTSRSTNHRGPSRTNLRLATWNIRELGKSPRWDESIALLAATISLFDLVSVVELRDNLGDNAMARMEADSLTEIDRKSARLMLANAQSKRISQAERQAIVEDWWGVDERDSEIWWFIDESLKKLMSATEQPEQVPSSAHDNLVVAHFYKMMRGTRNEWLLSELRKIGVHWVSLMDEPEAMSRCPCCLHFSIRERFDWEICPVCHWQDDTLSDTAVSPANGKSLVL